MAILSRKATIQIDAHTVTLDKEDIDRVAIHEWKPTRGDQNQITFYTDLGTPGRSAFQLLSGFVLNAPLSTFVELIRRDGTNMFDYRKSNLRVR